MKAPRYVTGGAPTEDNRVGGGILMLRKADEELRQRRITEPTEKTMLRIRS